MIVNTNPTIPMNSSLDEGGGGGGGGGGWKLSHIWAYNKGPCLFLNKVPAPRYLRVSDLQMSCSYPK